MSVDQSYKQTHGKPRISLVPLALVEEVAKVRTWAVDNKYPDPDSWRGVPENEYLDAILRHMVSMMKNGFDAKDSESGFLHAAHVATNIAFILALIGERDASKF